jgi:hypothetical protein
MTDGGRDGRRPGRFRRLLGRPERSERAPAPVDEGAGAVRRQRIADCRELPGGRPVVTVSGTLRAVGERTVGGSPALEAELDDGTASLGVVWLGRRSIAGVEPGRELTASGRVAAFDGRPVLFNPRYELRAQRTSQ